MKSRSTDTITEEEDISRPPKSGRSVSSRSMTRAHVTFIGPSTLTCEQARRLLARTAVDDPAFTGDEADGFALHIANCSECAKAFYVAEGVNEDGSFRPEDEARYALVEPSLMTVEVGWGQVLDRCPELADANRRELGRQRARQALRRAGQLAALAACLALVVASGWIMSGHFWSGTLGVGRSLARRTVEGRPQVASGVKSQAEDQLDDMRRELWRVPASPDVDTLQYATWRDEHKQFAPVSRVQLAMQANPAARPDWIELMIVSGDIWQFRYDPKLPPDQRLATIEPVAIARLAQHYGLDQRELMRSIVQPETTPVSPSPVQGPTPGQQYAQAMGRWHDALAATVQDKTEINRDLMLFSLRATEHLATARTAAYLWAKTYPEQAGQLLADSGYGAMLPLTLAGSGEDRLKELRRQATAARSARQAAMEWFVMPKGNGCTPQAVQQQRKLAAMVAELMLASPARRREGKGQ